MMASGVRRSKHALLWAHHPAPMIIASTEERHGKINPLCRMTFIMVRDNIGKLRIVDNN